MYFNLFRKRQIVALLIIILSVSCSSLAQTHLTPTILEVKPHDTNVFTQGLYLHNGYFFESSGLYGKSFLQRIDASTNEVNKHAVLHPNIFAEGVTVFQDKVYMLTWRAGKLLIFDDETLSFKYALNYKGQGWGLTHNAQELIMSDGSSKIYFRDPKTFKIKRTIKVHDQWRQHSQINELEYVDGAIWANVWLQPYILKIDPKDGKVLATVSLTELVKQNSTQERHTVLNGIAYDAQRDAFWITGKLWPNRYLIKLEPQKTDNAIVNSKKNHNIK